MIKKKTVQDNCICINSDNWICFHLGDILSNPMRMEEGKKYFEFL